MTLTAQRLRELLSYDARTGGFTWAVSRGGNAKAGTVAGTVNSGPRCGGGGYRNITIDGKRYYAHRLAWLYVNGSWPEHEIDHRDLDRDNNRFVNLREATRLQNLANRPLYRNSTTGFKGVTVKHRRWRARIKVNGQEIYLGSFESPEQAHAAYAMAAVDIHGEYAKAA